MQTIMGHAFIEFDTSNNIFLQQFEYHFNSVPLNSVLKYGVGVQGVCSIWQILVLACPCHAEIADPLREAHMTSNHT